MMNKIHSLQQNIFAPGVMAFLSGIEPSDIIEEFLKGFTVFGPIMVIRIKFVLKASQSC